jgi:hypothetical protein
MAGIRTNLPEVIRAIKAIAQSWDLRSKGRYKSLGVDMLDIVAEGIYERTVIEQEGPDGEPLAPLAPSTLARKARLGFPETIGVEHAKMLALEELKGERMIERRTASVIYGKDEQAKEEAEWFQDPSNPNQPDRQFMGLDERIEATIDALFEEVLDRNIREQGGN